MYPVARVVIGIVAADNIIAGNILKRYSIAGIRVGIIASYSVIGRPIKPYASRTIVASIIARKYIVIA